MTFIIGQTFDIFGRFPSGPNASQADRDRLLHDMSIAAFELIALAGGSLALSSVMSSLWIWVGERNVARLRRRVYESVAARELVWFDLQVTHEDGAVGTDGEAVGAGGMMSKFSNETDQVRSASSLNTGMLIQYGTTACACLVLAFVQSWLLTLVILSVIPLVIIVQGVSQSLAVPLYNRERACTAQAGTRVDRAVASIATVKAFNASKREQAAFANIVDQARVAYKRCAAIWGAAGGFTHFTLFAMFVQGYWFGSKLVREGKITPGQVTGVFWACLIASSNLQMCIPLLVVLTKGKSAMVSLLALIEAPTEYPAPEPTLDQHTSNHTVSGSTSTTLVSPPPAYSKSQSHTTLVRRPTALSKRAAHITRMAKITPSKCHGGFTLHEIRFAYPARPAVPVLNIKSMDLAAGETTFIVGGSGSGKSTVAQLLMGMYDVEPRTRFGYGGGSILLDDQELRVLDPTWVSEHVALVSQSCILFEMSIHDNVAIGLAGSSPSAPRTTAYTTSTSASAASYYRRKRPEDVTREEVENVCRAALMHEFVRDLPNGYDTMLGVGGQSLSGGQKQRLAIARAMMRDPTVLILDEATSALDATSRILVFEAIKQWRRNRTTIVITHDLSQITPDDFVYVMKAGSVVEEGYRYALEEEYYNNAQGRASGSGSGSGWSLGRSEFCKLLEQQSAPGGFPVQHTPELDMGEPVRGGETFEEEAAVVFERDERKLSAAWEVRQSKRLSLGGGLALRPPSMNMWMLDAVADLAKIGGGGGSGAGSRRVSTATTATAGAAPFRPYDLAAVRRSTFFPEAEARARALSNVRGSLSSVELVKMRPQSSLPPQSQSQSGSSGGKKKERRRSLQFEPTSPTTSSFTVNQKSKSRVAFDFDGADEWDEEFEREKQAMEASGAEANRKRSIKRVRSNPALNQITVDIPSSGSEPAALEKVPSIFKILARFYSTVPNKPVIFFGLLAAVANGAMTPVFSFLLARLFAQVGTGAKDASLITTFALMVLAAAAGDGLAVGCKFFFLESGSMTWAVELRKRCFQRVMQQDKAFFDAPDNAPQQIVQRIIADADEARSLISTVLGPFVVVATMLSVGLIWAMAIGWQLTLVGIAIGPVFAVCMALQTMYLGRFEVRNKRAREVVAKKFYESVANVRAIRAMTLGSVFKREFEIAIEDALEVGVRGAFVAGLGYGVANGLIYAAEALLFYVSAVFMARGEYSYQQMLEVLNLVVFSVSVASQMMTFVPKIAKAKQAAHDLGYLLKLTEETSESHGQLRHPIKGDIIFDNVTFSYPQRPDAPVLTGLSCQIKEGETVAIVGSSGSGKSTIAALLQRLYEPTEGSIKIGRFPLSDTEVVWLRNRITVVSQQPALFDATVTENICYGSENAIPFSEVERAARDANLHDFIMGLPKAYDTMLGENAGLISGGQAQRLQIARALVNGHANVLIFDECTSALDSTNQAAVMATMKKAAIGRTAIVVTHKVSVMQMCDRIIVLHEGVVAEEGSYEALMQRKGTFHRLASGGEWAGE
ncbi:hypothetical protein BOTBODRAFT_168162 [Botryobasidium botryosum FD-172 SS1]|uniref:P-loop containing nucleoside triphosphate hydrolase protein n=1 Tax=Botryobasidium botryosum (strain FD-172 SS1) TaxID=930990 RepID=A0A067LSP2_BOTB1|nr:hypothetical protein BOTBODRAFT_168162 [Botryobasidium botryosum FD-172 SS1]